MNIEYPEPTAKRYRTYVEAHKINSRNPPGPYFEDKHWEWRQRQLQEKNIIPATNV